MISMNANGMIVEGKGQLLQIQLLAKYRLGYLENARASPHNMSLITCGLSTNVL